MYRIAKTVCGVMVNVMLFIALGLPTIAQKKGSKKQAEPRSKPQNIMATHRLTATQQAALSVLDQLSESARKFEDDLLRLRTQAQVADMLWDYDAPRARRDLEFRVVGRIAEWRAQRLLAG